MRRMNSRPSCCDGSDVVMTAMTYGALSAYTIPASLSVSKNEPVLCAIGTSVGSGCGSSVFTWSASKIAIISFDDH